MKNGEITFTLDASNIYKIVYEIRFLFSLLKCLKGLHYSGEEIDNIKDFEGNISRCMLADLIFIDLAWRREMKNKIFFRNHLQREPGEDKNHYMKRIFEDNNPRVMVTIIWWR